MKSHYKNNKEYYQKWYRDHYSKNKDRYDRYNKNRPSQRKNYVGIEIDGKIYVFSTKTAISFQKVHKDDLDKASDEDLGMKANIPVKTDMICPACNKDPLLIRNSSNGVFLGCSGYSNAGDDQCKNTKFVVILPKVLKSALEVAA